METLAVARSIWIAAPRERVWQAITDPEQIAQWFLPSAFGAQMTRDDSGKLSVMLGPMNADVAIFEASEPPRRAVSRSLPDRLLTTTYTLDAVRDGTQVTVTMTGFEALPEDARQDRLEPSGRSWEKALMNLKAYIDGVSLPHPEGFTAALYGYRRETPKQFAVERSIWIAASRERVWRAITDPAQIELWFSPGTQWRSTGQEVGARLSVYDPTTNTDMYVQIVDLIDPPHRLATRTDEEPVHVTTWTLTEENGGTRVTITYSGYEREAEDVRYSNMEQNAFGFGMMLENLKAVVEGTSLPYPGGF
jgi:uncharacterized protein YndB with AHSA1/START domain